MAPERKGGLGRGLAALIPSAPAEMDKSGKTGAIGNGASDIIFGTQSKQDTQATQAGSDDEPKTAPASKSKPKKRTTKALSLIHI